MKLRIAIIGAGPGGYVAALRAAQLGAQVCLIEKDALGGTCLNRGCIPSKVMRCTAELMNRIHRAEQFGIQVTGPVTVDMAALMERKTSILKSQIAGIDRLLKRRGVSLIQGHGAVAGPGRLEVKTESGERHTVPWDRLILAPGSRPLNLRGLAFDGDRILSSDDIFRLTAVPESMVIVGGGVIGCEFACLMSALGARVYLVEALDRLLPLPSVDEDCSDILAREMKKQNIQVVLRRTVSSVEREANGLKVSLGPMASPPAGASASRYADVTCEKMLICVGRQPDTAELGLETIGLDADEGGWLAVNDHMETGLPGVYAIGDVLGPGKVMLAHVAWAEGMVAAENALGGERLMRYDAVPSAIFTIPEVANVGLTQSQAAERDIRVRADSVLFRSLGKAQAIGELAGQAKIISRADSGEVLGVHLIGTQATDLIAEGTLAVQTGCRAEDLAATIHAHPTLSEVIWETALKAANRPLHG